MACEEEDVEWWEVRALGLPLRAGPSLAAEVVGEVVRQQRIQVSVAKPKGWLRLAAVETWMTFGRTSDERPRFRSTAAAVPQLTPQRGADSCTPKREKNVMGDRSLGYGGYGKLREVTGGKTTAYVPMEDEGFPTVVPSSAPGGDWDQWAALLRWWPLGGVPPLLPATMGGAYLCHWRKSHRDGDSSVKAQWLRPGEELQYHIELKVSTHTCRSCRRMAATFMRVISMRVLFAEKYVPRLDDYEWALSYDINSALRHQIGRKSDYFGEVGLKCDDGGWVMLDDFLAYEHGWRLPHLRRHHIPFRTWIHFLEI
eukprot:s252_g17.t1